MLLASAPATERQTLTIPHRDYAQELSDCLKIAHSLRHVAAKFSMEPIRSPEQARLATGILTQAFKWSGQSGFGHSMKHCATKPTEFPHYIPSAYAGGELPVSYYLFRQNWRTPIGVSGLYFSEDGAHLAWTACYPTGEGRGSHLVLPAMERRALLLGFNELHVGTDVTPEMSMFADGMKKDPYGAIRFYVSQGYKLQDATIDPDSSAISFQLSKKLRN